MKKFLFLILSLSAVLSVDAQWKVTSVDEYSNKGNELLQIVETDQSVFIYGIFNQPVDEIKYFSIPRKTTVEVNGESYKIKRSVNLPLFDDADKQWAVLEPSNYKMSYLVEFEKFPVVDGFSIVSQGTDDYSYDLNNKGIHIEKIDSSEQVKTGRFLDGGTPLLMGRYNKDGKDFLYYIRENVSITFHTEWNNKDLLYFIDIVNKSDRGVNFNVDNVYVTASKSGKDDFNFVKYSPSSYEQYFIQKDHDEAKEIVGGMTMVGEQIDRTAMTSTTYGSWGRLGLDLLSSIAKQSGENDIQEYMKAHPKEHPKALQSNGIKPGETYQGYVAFKYKKSDSQVFHFKMEGYDYTMKSKF